ncbi:hypothetical protein ACWGDX_24120 [Streptomyces sp. NPDC055025]
MDELADASEADAEVVGGTLGGEVAGRYVHDSMVAYGRHSSR